MIKVPFVSSFSVPFSWKNTYLKNASGTKAIGQIF